MAAALSSSCLSDLSRLPNRNHSFISGSKPCNRSAAEPPPYSPQATAAFAISITFMMISTIVGNILVIMAVLTSRSLRGPQNLFLVSLAAADILVATLIIPFSLANELQGFWAFSSVWCEIYLALDVLFCTSSIVHLCAVALDRYLSISQPVSYGPKRTPSRIKAAIIVVWLISAVISFPPLLSLDKSEGGADVCELNSERWYILYSTIGSFFAPCVIMILVYVRIYQIAKKHTRCPARDEGKKLSGNAGVGAHEPPQQNGEQGTKPAGLEEKVLEKTSGSEKQQEDRRGRHSHSSSSEAEMEEGGVVPAAAQGQEDTDKTDEQVELSPSGGFKGRVQRLACRYKSTVATPSGTTLVSEGGVRLQATPMSRRKAMVNREKRFTFVLAVVMGVFVICWFPFFFSYSLQAVCPETCSIPPPLFKFFFWIGYCNSCLNPVIYTIFNQDFRKAFKRILCRDTKGTFF
ncbi:alpha-2B adrenergic receptor isoform X1 [Genypterus blacodes]|uniref:alpha-2B adrenergic receptor isoform X1 n=1 Tax=Genypterus blacodes TaxID=154954 RepID=UPI003F767CA4